MPRTRQLPDYPPSLPSTCLPAAPTPAALAPSPPPLPAPASQELATAPFPTQVHAHGHWASCMPATPHRGGAAVEEMLPFTASPALGVMMLNHFVWLLGESDVTKVHWAQYMEVDVASNGTALLDYQGNARPAWHSFRFWGDLPIERAVGCCSPSL